MTALRTIGADPVQHEPYAVVQTRVRRQRWRAPAGEPTSLIVLLVIAAAVLTAVRCAEWASSAVRVPLPSGLVGSLERAAPERHLVGSAQPTAAACSPGQAATFSPAFNGLTHAIGEIMGKPLECAHEDPTSGDLLQVTSRGLAVYRAVSHAAVFTDGYRHWALSAERLLAWEGTAVDPPE